MVEYGDGVVLQLGIVVSQCANMDETGAQAEMDTF